MVCLPPNGKRVHEVVPECQIPHERCGRVTSPNREPEGKADRPVNSVRSAHDVDGDFLVQRSPEHLQVPDGHTVAYKNRFAVVGGRQDFRSDPALDFDAGILFGDRSGQGLLGGCPTREPGGVSGGGLHATRERFQERRWRGRHKSLRSMSGLPPNSMTVYDCRLNPLRIE